MIGQTFSHYHIVIKLGGTCKVRVRALDWSHRVPRLRWALFLQAVSLILVALVPKAQAQGLATPRAAPSRPAPPTVSTVTASSSADAGTEPPRRWRFATRNLRWQ
jgi:hypothetical protein